MLTVSEAFDTSALASLIASANLLGTALEAGLYTNAITPSKTLVIADMIEPTWATYARLPVVMAAAHRDPINGISSTAEGLVWQQTGVVVPVIIQGIFYVYGAGPAFLGIEPFASPIALNNLLDAFTTILSYIQSQENAGFTTLIR